MLAAKVSGHTVAEKESYRMEDDVPLHDMCISFPPCLLFCLVIFIHVKLINNFLRNDFLSTNSNIRTSTKFCAMTVPLTSMMSIEMRMRG